MGRKGFFVGVWVWIREMEEGREVEEKENN